MFLINNKSILRSNKQILNISQNYSNITSNRNPIEWHSKKSIVLRCDQQIQRPFNRQLFGFPLKPNVSKFRRYRERRLLGYSKEQLYEVVSRVEDYHLFVPACVKSKVSHRTHTYLCAELEIGIPPLIWEKYTSRVTLCRPDSVSAKCIDGKLFKHLETNWKFGDGLADNQLSCTLDFSLSFEFRSLIHSQLVYVFFDEMTRQTVNAFLKRAQQLYGKQSLVINSNPLTQKT